MKYLAYIYFTLAMCLGSLAATPIDNLDKDGIEPLAIFEVTIHLERANNHPVYSELHEMTELELDLDLGNGERSEGSWADIDWKNNLVFIRITKRDAQGTTEALSMAKFTANGLKIKKLYNSIENFALNFVADSK